MKVLKDILQGVSIEAIAGDPAVRIAALELDSRRVEPGALFAAIRGAQADGHAYISQAISRGAVAVLCQVMPEVPNPHITYVLVSDTARALAFIAANHYDNPASQLKLVGVTGTNGKTTTATLCYQLFSALGYPCGLISTIQILIAGRELPTQLTTPDVITLNRVLRKMVSAGVAYAFMEVSSQGIVQQRVAGLHFTAAVFTNLTRDHLDYHKTFARYRDAKKRLFDGLSPESFALFNADDKNGTFMVQNTQAKVYTYALRCEADFKARVLENSLSGMLLSIGDTQLCTLLVGGFNAYNLLAAYGLARLFGQDSLEVLEAMSLLKSPKGRFQYFRSDTGIHTLIDFAHTPDALSKLLDTVNDIRARNEKLITLVGCGGNRDKSKRPDMARIAVESSDEVIFTSDNPRYEDPSCILEDMWSGISPDLSPKVLTIADRRQAIRTACERAAASDIIIMAGKGHETYQEIAGVRYPFDESEILKACLQELDK